VARSGRFGDSQGPTHAARRRSMSNKPNSGVLELKTTGRVEEQSQSGRVRSDPADPDSQSSRPAARRRANRVDGAPNKPNLPLLAASGASPVGGSRYQIRNAKLDARNYPEIPMFQTGRRKVWTECETKPICYFWLHRGRLWSAQRAAIGGPRVPDAKYEMRVTRYATLATRAPHAVWTECQTKPISAFLD
jgi:hypothetical protein